MAPGPRQVRQGHEDDLLGAGRERPAGRYRLSEDAEITCRKSGSLELQSITSVARARSAGGPVSPSSLAVCRLISSSKAVVASDPAENTPCAVLGAWSMIRKSGYRVSDKIM